MRKPCFCLCKNKGADQLRSNCEADQRLCFRYTDSTIPLLPKSKISSIYLSSVVAQTGLCQTRSESLVRASTCRPRNFSEDLLVLWGCKQFSLVLTAGALVLKICMGGSRGGPDPPPWDCQIIDFCHVEIFRQTPSGAGA